MIVVNLLGNGVSTSPSNVAPPDGRDRWPLVSVFDNVQAQAALLDALGVGRIALVYGYSMGAMQVGRPQPRPAALAATRPNRLANRI